VEIPLSYEIKCLNGFSVCFFKDKYHRKESPSHYYIVIPTKHNSYLIISMVTSQWEKKIAYYRKSNTKCLNSLILVEQTDLAFLKNKSVIDCNSAEYIHKHELSKRITPKSYKFISESIPDNLKKKIVESINKSPLIKPYIKQSIKFEEQ